jgi:hypothetical protein
MRRLVFLGLAALSGVHGQSLVDSAHLDAARSTFASAGVPAPLKCQFTPFHPLLNFGLRFQTGFVVEVPLRQFHGPSHGWDVLIRVTPEGRDSVFLTVSEALPDVPDTNSSGEFIGTFVTGEGSYQVDALLKDDAQRVCKASWRIIAKPDVSQRGLRPSLPAGTVAELAVKPAANASRAGVGRLTVFLHAAPLMPGRAKLQPGDISTLLNSMSALLEQLPARSVRLVIFSLDERAVLYRKDGFGVDDLSDAEKILAGLQLAVVDYRTLQNSAGPVETTAKLFREEMAGPEAPDVVVVLSPYAALHAAEQAAAPPAAALASPKLFYVQLNRLPGRFRSAGFSTGPPPGMGPVGRRGNRPPQAPGPVAMDPLRRPDAIAVAVKAAKGETIPVTSPNEFAAALGRILTHWNIN